MTSSYVNLRSQRVSVLGSLYWFLFNPINSLELLAHISSLVQNKPRNSQISRISHLLQVASMSELAKKSDLQAQRLLVLNQALETACQQGLVETVTTLLENGADPNAKAYDGRSILVTACEMGVVDIVKNLLQFGANVNTRDDLGVDLSKWKDQFSGTNYGNALQTACAEHFCNHDDSYGEIIDLLLEAGADPNIVCGYYGTPLVAACSRRNLDTVKKLLSYNADVTVQVDRLLGLNINLTSWNSGYGGREYGTALQTACAMNNVQIVKELLTKNPDIWVEGGSRGSAINAASSIRDNEILQSLFEHDAAHSEVTATGQTDKSSASAVVPGMLYTDLVHMSNATDMTQKIWKTSL